MINLDVEPARARDYGVNQHGQVAFVNSDPPREMEGRYSRWCSGAIHIPGDPQPLAGRPVFANPELEPQTGQVIESDRNSLEQRFVTPLLQVSGSGEKTVFFLTGHGERNSVSPTEENGYLLAAELLRSEGYRVETLDLQTKTLVPRQTGETQDEPLNENEVAPTLIVVAGAEEPAAGRGGGPLPIHQRRGPDAAAPGPRNAGQLPSVPGEVGPLSWQRQHHRPGRFIGEERTPFISPIQPRCPPDPNIRQDLFPGGY